MDDTQIFVPNETGEKIELTLLTVVEAKQNVGSISSCKWGKYYTNRTP